MSANRKHMSSLSNEESSETSDDDADNDADDADSLTLPPPIEPLTHSNLRSVEPQSVISTQPNSSEPSTSTKSPNRSQTSQSTAVHQGVAISSQSPLSSSHGQRPVQLTTSLRATIPPPSLPSIQQSASISTRTAPITVCQTRPGSSSSPQPHLSTSNSGCNIVNATDRRVLTLLAEIKADLRDLKRHVVANSQLLFQLSSSGIDLEELPEDISLPVQTLENLMTLDERVKTDTNVEKRLILTLAAMGGEDLPSAVRRMMMELMQNDVAKVVNWTGQGEKKAFKELSLKKVLEKSIRKNPKTSDASPADIQGQVVRFFKGSSDRNGGRKARMPRQAGEE